MMKSKPRRSTASSRALDAVARVPATAGDIATRSFYVGERRTSVRLDAPTLRALDLTTAIRCYVVGYLIEAASARAARRRSDSEKSP